MSTIKSFSVGNGDMFYIDHNSDNFSIIDCCLSDENKDRILSEIYNLSRNKGVSRFISTHPDDDHLMGLKYLDDKIAISNFYCVKNNTTKEEPSEHFEHYCKLRDSDKVYHIHRYCSRKWMNLSCDERGSSGISVVWPVTSNQEYKDALKIAEDGGSPNNISPVIKYSLENGVDVLWMGDLEMDFMEKIKDAIVWPKAQILFAPHHGRKSGKIPEKILTSIDPKIIIIGEAPSEDLNYYSGYNTITQNSAGDISLECLEGKTHLFVSNEDYSVDFLDNENISSVEKYLGTLNV